MRWVYALLDLAAAGNGVAYCKGVYERAKRAFL